MHAVKEKKATMFASDHIEWILSSILILLYSITIIGLVLVIIAENRNPLKTIPWVIVLLLAPGVGLLFYFFFGQDNRKQRIISRRIYKRIMKKTQEGKLPQDSCEVPASYRPLATLLTNSNQSSLLYGTEIKIFTNGADKFKALMEALRQAQHHIHLQYYIFNDDEIGNQVKKILIEKAKSGIEVRVIYDDVGCWNVKKRFFQEMREAGIETYAFLRVAFPILTNKVNYRNHRKIVVVDGKIGFMGGMNIADRYVKGVKWGVWRDTHFQFTGKGVQSLLSQSAHIQQQYPAISDKRSGGAMAHPAASHHLCHCQCQALSLYPDTLLPANRRTASSPSNRSLGRGRCTINATEAIRYPHGQYGQPFLCGCHGEVWCQGLFLPTRIPPRQADCQRCCHRLYRLSQYGLPQHRA